MSAVRQRLGFEEYLAAEMKNSRLPDSRAKPPLQLATMFTKRPGTTMTLRTVRPSRKG